jgi:hypothetical protein
LCKYEKAPEFGAFSFGLISIIFLFDLREFIAVGRSVVDRQLLTFLCFRQRKVSKRKRPHVAALRVPVCAGQKMGKRRNSLRSNTTLSDPFSAQHKRQRLKRIKFNCKVRQSVQGRLVLSIAKPNTDTSCWASLHSAPTYVFSVAQSSLGDYFQLNQLNQLNQLIFYCAIDANLRSTWRCPWHMLLA